MDLFQKFAAVEIQADNRISETDKQFCEKQQAAYETAVMAFKELSFFWEDMNMAQQKLLGSRDGPFFNDYALLPFPAKSFIISISPLLIIRPSPLKVFDTLLR